MKIYDGRHFSVSAASDFLDPNGFTRCPAVGSAFYFLFMQVDFNASTARVFWSMKMVLLFCTGHQ
jgi:hypothetical protein